ncbi:hypothetical protein SLEP1_g45469 [Rubroshorea leprosula]|uniref:Uncharacterized protein n=1 Tax=Rubroshorea leprosula TaxID=152421 RepID=A0AAV5LJW5_9ROSI|nr:hypothetical protein SLEP1_g45469 [Rubroshorea leprosula]
MEEITQLAEAEAETGTETGTETGASNDISITIINDCTSMERRTVPNSAVQCWGRTRTYQFSETNTSFDEPVAIGEHRKRKRTLHWPMLNHKICRPNLRMGVEKDYPMAKSETSSQDYPMAKSETRSHVSIAIQNDPTSMEQRTMRRLPPQLLEVNKGAYEPYVISFGPYHRNNFDKRNHLKDMEGRKAETLNRLLELAIQGSDKIHLSATGTIVKEARNCYSESSYLSDEEFSDEEFVKMMVLDGCFIIQLITGTLKDSFCTQGLIYTSILRDLVLVENQLPFFVLCKLLDKIPKTFFNPKGSTDPKRWFISQLLRRFEDTMPGLRVDRTYDDDSMKKVKHIVHLLHSNWLPSDKAMTEYNEHPKDGKWRFIRSATELREAGIEFEMVETEGNRKRSLFDINFEKGKGILKMQKLTIEDDTESLYRNLIACEQFDNELPAYLLDYVTVMDCLINTGKDVELLCKSKIIDNLLGDDESVAALFNKLGDHAKFSRKSFFYAQLFNDINEHYEKPWNTWKANLRQKYFNTPWAFISFLAATLLILLTVLQTTFTIFPRS